MPLVDPVIERVLADFERRAEEEQRRTFAPGAPGTNLDDLLLSVGREAGMLLYLLASGGKVRRILELGTSYGYSTVSGAPIPRMPHLDHVRCSSSPPSARSWHRSICRS